MSTISMSSAPPGNLSHHLLQRAHHHGAAPDHRGFLVHQEPDGHAGQAPGGQGHHLVAPDLGLAVQAEHAGERRAVNVGVEKADFQPLTRQRHGQIHRDGGFAHTALSGGHRDDGLDLGQQHRCLRGGAVRVPMIVRVRLWWRRRASARLVRRQHGGGVGDTGLPAEHLLRLPPHRLHGRRLRSVGQQADLHQTVADLDPLDQSGRDDIAPGRGILDGTQRVAERLR